MSESERCASCNESIVPDDAYTIADDAGRYHHLDCFCGMEPNQWPPGTIGWHRERLHDATVALFWTLARICRLDRFVAWLATKLPAPRGEG